MRTARTHTHAQPPYYKIIAGFQLTAVSITLMIAMAPVQQRKKVRDWRKNQSELQRLSEEDSNRARLPAGGRKKAREEPEINMRG